METALVCRCGKKARLDDVCGKKLGNRDLYYKCDNCSYGYRFHEDTGDLLEFAPDEYPPF